MDGANLNALELSFVIQYAYTYTDAAITFRMVYAEPLLDALGCVGICVVRTADAAIAAYH